MNKVLKLLLTCVICLVSASILYFAGIIIYASFTTFNPEHKMELHIVGNQTAKADLAKVISLMTWNIGYAGLGKEMDFFYEGGKLVRPEKTLSIKYLDGISGFLSQNDTIDIVLLQEVDFNSKRSYGVNEFKRLEEVLSNHSSLKAINYKSGFVPVPFSEPMGKVNSGMAVFSRFTIRDASRIATPGQHPWPKRLFTLKRCFILTHIPIENSDKEVVVINVHNSAFGDEAELRKAELGLLKRYLIEEYEAGNFVIAGGDWNQNPPGFDHSMIRNYNSRENWSIENTYLPEDWNWSYDPSFPTNRDVAAPFDLQSTSCTILDYFVTSPNIEVLGIQTIDLGFEYSDHQPVIIKLKLQ
ncbi:MAG: endonuclease/exonuclease/phosphatase family protein [Bacteroidetes bacterium]|nr:endonuclease/exonuclease/phosphatase family protein [Bacteroidota bacterium]